MRLIRKSAEPRSLTEFRQHEGPNVNFESLPSDIKSDIRAKLLREQGKICCYCMNRIGDDSQSTRIEHWQSQSLYPHLTLSWPNLFASCTGNEGAAPSAQHCDVKKHNTPITLSPLNPLHIQTLSYTSDGAIHSSDTALSDDLSKTLNLNHPTLKNNRKSALTAMTTTLEQQYKSSAIPIKRLHDELSRCDNPDGQEKLPPYAGVLAAWLRKRLKRYAPSPNAPKT